jgi:hypothetical protein
MPKKYTLTSYWIMGDMGETIKTEEFTSPSKAEYQYHLYQQDDICSFSELRMNKCITPIMAKPDCSYCKV